MGKFVGGCEACGNLREVENVELKMVRCRSFWGEAPFHLLQPVLLGVLTGLVWMVLGIFACRTNVWYFMAMAFGFAEILGILTWLFGLMFVLVIGSERTYA